jgi:ribosomal protein S27AE
MTTPTTWLLDESCPDCGTGLTLFDDGTSLARAECGSCGYADVRAVTVPAGGGGR